MTYAVEAGPASPLLLDALREIASDATLPWKFAAGRDFQTLDVTSLVASTVGDALDRVVTRAFFLRIPARGGNVHRHRDVGDVETLHIPVLTNDLARSFWLDGSEAQSMHMHVGRIYRVNRTIEHWAVNEGNTDRVHLIVEGSKQ